MDNQFAGQLNGKQKAWGFIVLLPLYFYVIPAVVNFVIYMLVKYGVFGFIVIDLCLCYFQRFY